MSKLLRKYDAWLSVVVIAIGIFVLLGWQFDIAIFRQPFPNIVGMNPMTAIAFIFSGFGLWLLLQKQENKQLLRTAKILAVLVSLIGSLKLIAVFNYYDAGIDRLLFSGKMAANLFDGKQNSMAPNTAFNFLLTGFSLLFLSHKKILISQYLSLLMALIALLSIIGYTYGVREFYGVLNYIPMAVHTAACFFILSTSILFARSDKGFMAEIISPYGGGKVARRLLPMAVLVPIIVGLFRLYGERIGLYSTYFGTALFTTITIGIFVFLIWKTVASINKSEIARAHQIAERIKMEEEIKKNNLFLETVFDNIPNMIFVKNGDDLRFAGINKAGEKLLGLSRQQLIGKNDYDFFPEKQADFFSAKDREVFSKGRVIDIEEEVINTVQGERWLHTKKIPVAGSNTTPQYMVGISEDITEKKLANDQLLQATQQILDLYNNAPCGYHSLDASGTFIDINDTELKWLGYQREEIIGKFRLSDLATPESQMLFQQKFPEFIKTGFVKDLMLEMVRKDGSVFSTILSSSAIYDEQGNYLRNRSIVIDYTERKKAKESLQNTLKEISDYRFALDESAIVAITDHKGIIRQVNDNFCKISKFSREELIGQDHRIINSGYHPKEFIRDLWVTIANGKVWRGELKNKASDGAYYWVDTTIVPFLNEQGEPYQYVAIRSDITARKVLEDDIKQLNQELQKRVDEKTKEVIEKEQQYRFLLQNMREGIQVIGYDWRYLFVNNSLVAQSKYSSEELLGYTMMEKYPGVENTELFNVLQRSMKTRCQQIAENEFIFPDGSKGWFELSIQPVPEGLFILTMDITERKKAEIQLQAANKELENHIIKVSESEEKLRLTLDAIGDNAWDHNFTTGKTTFSNTVAKLLGYSIDEHTDNAALWWENTYTEDRWMLEDNDKKYKAGEIDRHTLEYRMYHKDGSLKWILDRGVVIEKDKAGKPLRIVGSHTDTTERKNAEEVIRQSQERYFTLMNNVEGIVWEADAETFEFSFVSQQAERLLGYPVELWINNPSFWADHIYEEDRDWAINYCIKRTKERKPHEFEYRMVASDGKLVWLRDIVSVRIDNNGNAKISGVMIDITGQKTDELLLKKLNENLEKKTSELEASNTELERFAYIASHDLQEPLRMVSSFMGLLEKRMNGQLDETNKQYIHFAVDAAERMKMLIQALLQYSRIGNNKDNFDAIDLNEVMQYTTRVLKEDIQKSQAQVTVKSMPVITANKSLISQLFVNLVSNAMKYQGAEEPKIEVGYTETQSGWIFYVRDNGIGIDSKFFDKIFIIFQRLHNKNEYPGTGIGLAICKKIISIHNGKIWVKSEPGNGSTFYFSIPKQNA